MTTESTPTEPDLAPFRRRRTALLTTYKRDGMKAFEEMWEGDPTAEYQEKESIQDKITDLIFRMEEAAVGMYTEEMSTNRAEFQQGPKALPAMKDGGIRAQQEAAIAGSHQGADVTVCVTVGGFADAALPCSRPRGLA